LQNYETRSRIRIICNVLDKIIRQFKLIDFAAVFIALIILLPILNFLTEGIVILYKGQFNLGLTGKKEILGSIKILFLTSLIGGSLGILNGWLLSNCEFRFRKILRVCQLIPLAAPAYLITAILQDLASILGYHLTGMGWGVLILSISTYPYVFLLTNESFNKFGVNQINASRSLGVGPWKSFFKIALPMALPALVTGISLSCMEVMNELGTFELLNIPSISTGITESWNVDGNPKGAIGLSLFALLIVFSLILLEKSSRNKTRRWSENPSYSNSQGWKLSKFRSIFAIIISAFPALFSLGIPFIWVLLNIDQLQRGVSSELLILTLRTIILGLTASFVAIVFSIIVSFANRWNKSLFMRSITFLSGIGYAIPGTVLAISLLTLFNSKFIFMPIVLLIWGYVDRFLTISKGSLDSGLERISPNLDEAATGLGANWTKVIKEIHIPILKGPLFIGILLVFVDTIKELPITFLLRPFDFDTLSVRIYQYAGDERMAEAILPAILITILGLLASSTLIPTLEHKKD
tara:strand:- start:11636 stop:13204 length:1569 start_codon:yes stop_codon:yes gene_type:complete